MKNLISFLLIIVLGLFACNQPVVEEKIPITTNSEKAREYFDEAMTAYEDAYFYKVEKLFNKALEEDAEFFMADYTLALFYHFFKNKEKFKMHADNALKCKAKLSKGELLFKDALVKLLENPKADVTEIGKKIIELYPKDVIGYYQLYTYQVIINDSIGELSTLKSALEIAERPAILYNALGYVHMKFSQNEEAEKVFDKYIELEPELPNPYDSKGDFYMRINDYEKAYESFMKAHEIDSLWSYKKAMHAKAMADSLPGE